MDSVIIQFHDYRIVYATLLFVDTMMFSLLHEVNPNIYFDLNSKNK